MCGFVCCARAANKEQTKRAENNGTAIRCNKQKTSDSTFARRSLRAAHNDCFQQCGAPNLVQCQKKYCLDYFLHTRRIAKSARTGSTTPRQDAPPRVLSCIRWTRRTRARETQCARSTGVNGLELGHTTTHLISINRHTIIRYLYCAAKTMMRLLMQKTLNHSGSAFGHLGAANWWLIYMWQTRTCVKQMRGNILGVWFVVGNLFRDIGDLEFNLKQKKNYKPIPNVGQLFQTSLFATGQTMCTARNFTPSPNHSAESMTNYVSYKAQSNNIFHYTHSS